MDARYLPEYHTLAELLSPVADDWVSEASDEFDFAATACELALKGAARRVDALEGDFAVLRSAIESLEQSLAQAYLSDSEQLTEEASSINVIEGF